jgi:hypothetical protein
VRAPAFLALALGLLAASVPTWASQPAPAVAHTLHQGPCEEQFAAFPVPMAEAQAVAPPGFPPLPFDGERTVPPIPLLGTEVTVGYRCAATTSDDGLALGRSARWDAPSW